MELLAGIVFPSAGELDYRFINGVSWEDRYRQRRAKIHYVPTHAIQTFLQGHELFYQQRYYAMGDEQIPKVKDILDKSSDWLHVMNFPESFNIEMLLDLDVTRLSNGQLKKVLILKNLLEELPVLLLLDYPFDGLDHTSRLDLCDFLDHLARHHGVHLIITDHGHVIPSSINREICLDNFAITSGDPKPFTMRQPNIAETRAVSNPLAVVEMKNVTIRYGRKEIIRDFSWTINKGERWALTGRNGSGKTTLFSLIFADHPMAYSEDVSLFGKRRGSGESIWDIKDRISYLGPELLSYLDPKNHSQSAREFVIQMNKHSSNKEIESALEFFKTSGFNNKPLRHLSSGELQLTVIIANLLSDKELILLDEPFQFLDSENRSRVSHYIQSHLRENTTLVLITHDEQDIVHWTSKRLHLA